MKTKEELPILNSSVMRGLISMDRKAVGGVS